MFRENHIAPIVIIVSGGVFINGEQTTPDAVRRAVNEHNVPTPQTLRMLFLGRK